MFRILLPFLSNLFGGPFNPLELPTAQADSQGLDQSMAMVRQRPLSLHRGVVVKLLTRYQASSPIPTIKITPLVTVTNAEDHAPLAKPYEYVTPDF
jgi:hypothetical protein